MENTVWLISKYLIILEVQLYLNTLCLRFFKPSQQSTIGLKWD